MFTPAAAGSFCCIKIKKNVQNNSEQKFCAEIKEEWVIPRW